ncbi:MAG: hypothetical protein ABIH66_07600 [bacterium]
MGVESDQKDKKPYERPGIVSERIFETNALACGKCPNTSQVSVGGACIRGTTQSS